MSKLDVEVRRRAQVVWICRVELLQQRLEVVQDQARIGFDEHVPLGILAVFPRLHQHVQELVFVQIPPIGSFFQCSWILS